MQTHTCTTTSNNEHQFVVLKTVAKRTRKIEDAATHSVSAAPEAPRIKIPERKTITDDVREVPALYTEIDESEKEISWYKDEIHLC
jgi:hypothetical protein